MQENTDIDAAMCMKHGNFENLIVYILIYLHALCISSYGERAREGQTEPMHLDSIKI